MLRLKWHPKICLRCVTRKLSFIYLRLLKLGLRRSVPLDFRPFKYWLYFLLSAWGTNEIVKSFLPSISSHLNYLYLVLAPYSLFILLKLPKRLARLNLALTIGIHLMLIALVVYGWMRWSPRTTLKLSLIHASQADTSFASNFQWVSVLISHNPRIQVYPQETEGPDGSIAIQFSKNTEGQIAITAIVHCRPLSSLRFRSRIVTDIIRDRELTSVATKRIVQKILKALDLKPFDLGHIYPENDEAAQLYIEGTNALSHFKLATADSLLRKSIDLEPISPISHYKYSIVKYYRGYNDLAREHIKTAIRLCPVTPSNGNSIKGNPTLCKLVGFLLFMNNQLDEAEKVLRQGIAWDPTDLETRFWLAIALKRQGRFEDEITELEQITLIAALYYPIAYAELGVAYMRLALSAENEERYDSYKRKALEANQKYCEYDHDNPFAFVELGHRYKEVGALDQALEIFQKAESLMINQPLHEYRLHTLYGIGEVYFYKDQFDSSAIAFKQACGIAVKREESSSTLANITTMRGVAEFMQGKENVAMSLWSAANKWDPHWWRPVYWQAVCALKSENVEAAKGYALTLDTILVQKRKRDLEEENAPLPSNYYKLLLRGDIAKAEGDSADAKRYYQDAQLLSRAGRHQSFMKRVRERLKLKNHMKLNE